MLLWAAYASEFTRAVCLIAGALAGLWAAYHRLRITLRDEIRDIAATKEDIARVEGKIDILLSVIIGESEFTRKVGKL